MLPSFATETVVRRRAPTVDDGHGNQVPSWSDADDEPIEGCQVEPGGTSEVTAGRDATEVVFTVFMPEGTDLLSTDRVICRDVECEVDGEPGRWESGVLDHLEVTLRKWRG